MSHLSGRAVLTIALAAMLLAGAHRAFGEPAAVTPAEAIARAVAQRVGGGARVEVTMLDTKVAAERALHATPEPGGRAGAPMRFVLMVGRMRRGVAVATVTVVARYARAARAIGRSEVIGAGDIEVIDAELPAVGMKRLPDTADVVGLLARRDIAAGEALTQSVLDVPLAVRAGDEVELTVVAGTVRVTAPAKASSSGHEGETIRVTPEGGRALRARITGPGAVEVVQ
jgi:flagella basal body P-ring formation protein FlgA